MIYTQHAGTLEVRRKGNMSDCSCDYKRGQTSYTVPQRWRRARVGGGQRLGTSIVTGFFTSSHTDELGQSVGRSSGQSSSNRRHSLQLEVECVSDV
jgi:hypothetical protein